MVHDGDERACREHDRIEGVENRGQQRRVDAMYIEFRLNPNKPFTFRFVGSFGDPI